MNDELMSKIAWKIRTDKDVTMYQLRNGMLVDIIAMPIGQVLVRPYHEGKHDPDYLDEGELVPEDAYAHLAYVNKNYKQQGWS